MADPTSNNLPPLEPLSPAAQAVLDAVVSHPSFATRKRIAAAIRAAADQVVCADPTGAPDCCISIMEVIRADILAIATELENHQ